MNTRWIIEKVLLTRTALRSPLREDCNSFSSFSSFLLKLDIPVISNAMNLYRHPSISTIRHTVCVITTQLFPPTLLPLKSCGRFEYPSPFRACSSPSQKKLIEREGFNMAFRLVNIWRRVIFSPLLQVRTMVSGEQGSGVGKVSSNLESGISCFNFHCPHLHFFEPTHVQFLVNSGEVILLYKNNFNSHFPLLTLSLYFLLALDIFSTLLNPNCFDKNC